MDFKKSLSNPWVLGGGAALALVLILTSKGGSSGGNADAFISAQNVAGMNYAANSAALAATVQNHNIDAETQKTIGFLSVVQNMFDSIQVNNTQRLQVAAGVTNNRIQANTAYAVEALSIQERMAATWVSGDVAKYGIDANQDVAKYGMRTSLANAAIADGGATTRALGTATIKSGSDALNAILGVATSFIPKPKAA